ncbi:hypothetical protein JAB6_29400 [Janthinobacterium sp. HH104]|uniref:hypothetical protein n=1 Tax=Janthinobacterium sp. HH104 TaxID=1537276 RepID=UPI0008933A8E|nr:hypothetical protein [Janthinobacterium sp. HH104]OEZ83363.1 hypothetical protein JAB6_29400 [Janthinobacterium sp. HH104]
MPYQCNKECISSRDLSVELMPIPVTAIIARRQNNTSTFSITGMTKTPASVVHDHEWQNVSSEAPIRQGDLLVLRHSRTLSIQEKVLVITADCDFAQSKTGGAFAALRLLPLESYVRQFWTVKHAKRLLTIDHDELINSFNSLFAAASSNSKTLSKSAIVSWINRRNGKQICEELNVQDVKIQKKFDSCVNKLISLQLIEKSKGNEQCFEDIISFYSIKDNQTPEDARTSVLKKVRNELSALPEDAFLLSSFPEKPNEPHVVLLRQLVVLPLEKVTTSAEHAREENCYLRYGRLAPTFKYAVSQQFGLLYSRIGLPPEYDSHKKSLFESFSC